VATLGSRAQPAAAALDRFVFQRFFLLPMLSAAENVELPMSEAGVAARAPAAHA
jgi:predicted ABC-type transport system involved in lysophospholipase L1 biosynthesis ATPase subunit